MEKPVYLLIYLCVHCIVFLIIFVSVSKCVRVSVVVCEFLWMSLRVIWVLYQCYLMFSRNHSDITLNQSFMLALYIKIICKTGDSRHLIILLTFSGFFEFILLKCNRNSHLQTHQSRFVGFVTHRAHMRPWGT